MMQVRTSVMQTLARTLQDLIQRGEWKPEQKIPSQRILSEQYGVSRTSLHEALRMGNTSANFP